MAIRGNLKQNNEIIYPNMGIKMICDSTNTAWTAKGTTWNIMTFSQRNLDDNYISYSNGIWTFLKPGFYFCETEFDFGQPFPNVSGDHIWKVELNSSPYLREASASYSRWGEHHSFMIKAKENDKITLNIWNGYNQEISIATQNASNFFKIYYLGDV